MTTVFLTHDPEMLEHYYGGRAVRALQEVAEVRLNPTGATLDAAGLATHAAGCEIVVSDRQTAGFAEFFDEAPALVAFLRCAVDIRNVDVERASHHGILCTRATPGFTVSVAEMALGYMIDLARNISDSVVAYRSGREAPVRRGRQLKGATLGLVGYGAIARELAPMGVALGMRVLASDPFVRVTDGGVTPVDLPTLLAEADIVVCLVVANEATENLFDEAAFARMKPGAHFINVSRGNLVDEAALARALDGGRLAGAAMDVGRAPDQRPSLALARRPDVIATPHTAGLTPAAIEHQAFDTVAQVKALVAGDLPPGAVNADRASRMVRLKLTPR